MGIIITLKNGLVISYSSEEGLPIANIEGKGGIDFPLLVVDAGGNGDCFFHSLSYILHKSGVKPGYNYRKCRNAIANFIDTSEKADEFLRDLADQWDVKSDQQMVRKKKTKHFSLIAIDIWNNTINSPEDRIERVKTLIKTPGNVYWGESGTAAIAEQVFDVNIACLTVNPGFPFKIDRYIYGSMRNLMEKNESPPIKWDKPVVVLLNVGGIHWTPILTPDVETGDLNFLLAPEKFKEIFHEQLKIS